MSASQEKSASNIARKINVEKGHISGTKHSEKATSSSQAAFIDGTLNSKASSKSAEDWGVNPILSSKNAETSTAPIQIDSNKSSPAGKSNTLTEDAAVRINNGTSNLNTSSAPMANESKEGGEKTVLGATPPPPFGKETDDAIVAVRTDNNKEIKVVEKKLIGIGTESTENGSQKRSFSTMGGPDA